MTSAIKHKRSSQASRTPLPSELAHGELAINYSDGLLYFKDQANNVQWFASRQPLPYDGASLQLGSSDEDFRNAIDRSVIMTWSGAGAPPSNTANFSLITSTGYARVINWDGTLSAVRGNGNPGNYVTFIWPSLVTPYNARIPKQIIAYPTNASGSPFGTASQLRCGFGQLSSVDVTSLPSVHTLYVNNNYLRSIDLWRLPALNLLYCNNNLLRSLDLSRCTGLGIINCSYNRIESLIGLNRLSNLYDLNCSGNKELTHLNVSGLLNLRTLNASYCSSLISIRAEGVYSDYGSSSWYGAFDLRGSGLEAAALNQFYTDLAPGTGWIIVAQTPGAANPAHTPAIATAKGYTVLI
jgi:hypothetical protein